MAARLNRLHTGDVIKRIQASQLVTMLQSDAFGTLKSPQGKLYELSDGRRRSAMFLLERVLARAEAPKDLNLNFEGRVEVEFV